MKTNLKCKIIEGYSETTEELRKENRELREENAQLRKELEEKDSIIKELQEENEELREENQELREELYGLKRPEKYKKSSKSSESSNQGLKKRGPPFGHKGTSRKKPERVDKTVVLQFDA